MNYSNKLYNPLKFSFSNEDGNNNINKLSQIKNTNLSFTKPFVQYNSDSNKCDSVIKRKRNDNNIENTKLK